MYRQAPLVTINFGMPVIAVFIFAVDYKGKKL